ncbi:MAG: DUF983 domain-containing protein [Alphaproteobacteria bacterium]|nr:DUF983 domain-containing protein [Alphaproteobacteria bacterium]
MILDSDTLVKAMRCKCPRCGEGDLYVPGVSMTLREKCSSCGLDFSKNDSADGPAVFLIFILGFLLVPLALVVDSVFSPPLWVHAVLWSVVALGMTLGALRPLKSYIIALQYKHRPGDWE